MQSQPTDKNEIALPGFKTRHQIEFLAGDWVGLMNLLSWVSDEQGHVAFLRSRHSKTGCFEVSLGVENVSATHLCELIKSNNSFQCLRLEHLLVRQDEA